MVKKARKLAHNVDVACVIHGDKYDWQYVEKLYNGVRRNISAPVRFHVFTESDRSVPEYMIKHTLTDWPGIAGPKKSWWYKMQLFDPDNFSGPVLYFDLDVMIVNDITWITELCTTKFWAIKDFRHLQKTNRTSMNSSVMWWNVPQFSDMWRDFSKKDIKEVVSRYQGDQDYLFANLPPNDVRYFPEESMISWRWQALDGGYDFRARRHREPGKGTRFYPDTSVLVFHGHPKPHGIKDPVLAPFWV